MTAPLWDVAVVGAGVVGAAVARQLSHGAASVVLVEAGADVGAGTSKANTAILHTGFDATPATLEAGLVARGYHLLRAYAAAVGISVEETGAVLVAWSDEQANNLDALQAKAVANGYQATRVVDSDEVYDLEPHLGPGAVAGLLVPDEHLIDPWSTPIAFAREAMANGCALRTNFAVAGVEIGSETTTLTSATGSQLSARYVVNAAGLHGDTLHRLSGFAGFTIRPRRGELIVFDKLARRLLKHTVLPVPTAHTKGVLVAPTVFGNVMVGPTADDIDDRTATGTTTAGLQRLMADAGRLIPALADEEVTASYAGLRPATEHSDYQVVADAAARYVCLGGIRSTGLTASMALAEHAASLLSAIGLLDAVAAQGDGEIVPITMTPLGEADQRPYQRGGRVICHCERVTEAEIVAAVTCALPATDFDGIRRRTRALAGRCQGFYCAAEVCNIAAKHSGRPGEEWLRL